jgi:hypothetical protein
LIKAQLPHLLSSLFNTHEKRGKLKVRCIGAMVVCKAVHLAQTHSAEAASNINKRGETNRSPLLDGAKAAPAPGQAYARHPLQATSTLHHSIVHAAEGSSPAAGVLRKPIHDHQSEPEVQGRHGPDIKNPANTVQNVGIIDSRN